MSSAQSPLARLRRYGFGMLRLLVTVAVTFALPASASAAAPLPAACALLTDAQVAPAIGGSVQTHKAQGNRLGRVCTWTGAPMGFMQSREQLTVSVRRIGKRTFMASYQHGRPVAGLGSIAYSDIVGLAIWKDGIMLQLNGSYFSVYPAAGKRLARAALARL